MNQQENEVIDIESINREVADQMRALALRDPYYFIKEILGYDKLVERIHSDWCQFLTDPNEPLRGLLTPRESFKSTISCVGIPLWYLLKNPNTSIFLGGADLGRGRKWINNIKLVYEKCQLFRKLFPDHVNNATGAWLADEITVATRTDYKVQVPSIRIGSPDQMKTGDHYKIIIIDDAVVEENSGTKDMCDKTIDFIQRCFFLGEGNDVRIHLTGTRYSKHDAYGYFMGKGKKELDAFLEKAGLSKHGNVKTFDFRVEPVYEPNAYKQGVRVNQFPELFTNEALLMKEFSMNPWVFATQMQLDPISDITKPFKQEWKQYFVDKDIYDGMGRRRSMYIIVLCDPAEGKSADASKTAFIVLGIDTQGKIFILETRTNKYTPDEILDNIIDIQMTYRPNYFGIEEIGFQVWIEKALNEYVKGQGLGHINIQSLPANRGTFTKRQAIMGMFNYFSQMRIWLRPEQIELIDQLETYPEDMESDDLLRALSYLPFVETNGINLQQNERVWNYLQVDNPLTGR